MKNFITIIKSDYLQRTRSYAFLITLCISLAVAYSFIPAPGASYSTIRIGDYLGFYNSSWIGYVTALMTSIFLSLVGFYLVNGTIKNDINSKVGQIIATTRVSNFGYLLSKTISNFLVLCTIAIIIFIMSIILFFLYNEGFSFEILQFITPYSIIVIPSLFFISVLAVLFEVFFIQKSILQNVLFFFLFSIMALSGSTDDTSKNFYLDAFGTKIITSQMEETVRSTVGQEDLGGLNIGFVLGNVSEANHFLFDGVDFPIGYILSRIGWIIFGILLLGLASLFFHRFKVKERFQLKSKKTLLQTKIDNDIDISILPKVALSFKILPLIKTEFILLVRSGYKWLWILNIAGMLGLCFAPLSIAHQMILPILWFLQVSRWSSLVTKERIFSTHFFTFASYQPLKRLLLSQVLSGILLALLLALPLLLRYMIQLDFMHITSIILGGIFIVSLAVLTGILTKGKKLFEILFFMITYANINAIPFTDYFGGLHHQYSYLGGIAILVVILLTISYSIRNIELKRI
ncbi:hypothetical protein ATO12_01980 [Aquimarina atlantica]|uniref:Uncharacterized protein n=1 Tax=Aquimarina atlantica TaxID=1317122 RepID=A0A023BZS5_9FLAO|nr:hypothetical protein [Aquimarina atlantica]EZH75577.1 hypothetical protein ATO12_01980 [Aquimarina atlantica]